MIRTIGASTLIFFAAFSTSCEKKVKASSPVQTEAVPTVSELSAEASAQPQMVAVVGGDELVMIEYAGDATVDSDVPALALGKLPGSSSSSVNPSAKVTKPIAESKPDDDLDLPVAEEVHEPHVGRVVTASAILDIKRRGVVNTLNPDGTSGPQYKISRVYNPMSMSPWPGHVFQPWPSNRYEWKVKDSKGETVANLFMELEVRDMKPLELDPRDLKRLFERHKADVHIIVFHKRTRNFGESGENVESISGLGDAMVQHALSQISPKVMTASVYWTKGSQSQEAFDQLNGANGGFSESRLDLVEQVPQAMFMNYLGLKPIKIERATYSGYRVQYERSKKPAGT